MLCRHALAAKALPEKLENVRTNKSESEVEPVRKFREQVWMGSISEDLFYFYLF